MTAHMIFNESRLVKHAQAIQSKVDTIAVVKNDGYNLGLERVYHSFIDAGLRAFATTDLNEAIQLRKWNRDIFILMLDPCTDFQRIKEYDITLTVSSLAFCEKYTEQLKGIPLQLVFRNDLNRLGFTSAEEMIHVLNNEKLNVNGIWTHFASADDFGVDRYEKEVMNWQVILEELKEYLPDITYIHAQNSSSFVRDALLPFHTHIRAGVFLYGARPYVNGLDSSLADQVVTIQANVIDLTPVRAGQAMGYSASYLTDKDINVAVCDIGYGNGLLKARGNFPVLINEKEYPIRVLMMSHMLVEVDDDVKIGDTVFLYNDQLRFDWFASQGVGSFSQQMSSLNKQTFTISTIN